MYPIFVELQCCDYLQYSTPSLLQKHLPCSTSFERRYSQFIRSSIATLIITFVPMSPQQIRTLFQSYFASPKWLPKLLLPIVVVTMVANLSHCCKLWQINAADIDHYTNWRPTPKPRLMTAKPYCIHHLLFFDGKIDSSVVHWSVKISERAAASMRQDNGLKITAETWEVTSFLMAANVTFTWLPMCQSPLLKIELKHTLGVWQPDSDTMIDLLLQLLHWSWHCFKVSTPLLFIL